MILATIRLLADYGVDAVSLRMINRAAGSKNNSALHYHFGSKLRLVEAVDQFIQSHFDAVREPRLVALEHRASRQGVTIRDVMEVYVQAYVDIIDNYDWGYDAVRTLARMEFDADPEVSALLGSSASGAIRRFARLQRPLLPGIKLREFRMRFDFVVTSTIRGFAGYRNPSQSYSGDLSVKRLSDLARFYVNTGVAVMTAPP